MRAGGSAYGTAGREGRGRARGCRFGGFASGERVLSLAVAGRIRYRGVGRRVSKDARVPGAAGEAWGRGAGRRLISWGRISIMTVHFILLLRMFSLCYVVKFTCVSRCVPKCDAL